MKRDHLKKLGSEEIRIILADAKERLYSNNNVMYQLKQARLMQACVETLRQRGEIL